MLKWYLAHDLACSASEKIDTMTDGEHLGCIYSNEAESIQVCETFVTSRLNTARSVLFLVRYTTGSALKERLGYAEIELQAHERQAHVSSTHVDFYTEQDPEVMHALSGPQSLVEFMESRTKQALGQGFSGLSVWIEMALIEQNCTNNAQLVDYEVEMGRFLTAGCSCLTLCAYDRSICSPEIIRNALTTHPAILLGTEALENVYYVSPKFREHRDSAAAEVEAWLGNLLSRSSSDGEQSQSGSPRRSSEEEGELSRLGAYTTDSTTSVTRKMYGQRSLRMGCPDDFADLRNAYKSILNDSVEQRIYKSDYELPRRLQSLAQCLYRLDAGPRDVVELHIDALKQVSAGAQHKRARMLYKEARLLSLELMGDLVNEYRNRTMVENGGED